MCQSHLADEHLHRLLEKVDWDLAREACRQGWTVEDMIRTAKSILETRPIYHKCNETIRGHVFCSFLALLLKTELEWRMKFANLQCEWAQVVRGLEALQQVEATFQDKRFLLRSQLAAEASAALRATGVAAPPTLRELP